jgi:hypothetical protein
VFNDRVTITLRTRNLEEVKIRRGYADGTSVFCFRDEDWVNKDKDWSDLNFPMNGSIPMCSVRFHVTQDQLTKDNSLIESWQSLSESVKRPEEIVAGPYWGLHQFPNTFIEDARDRNIVASPFRVTGNPHETVMSPAGHTVYKSMNMGFLPQGVCPYWNNDYTSRKPVPAGVGKESIRVHETPIDLHVIGGVGVPWNTDLAVRGKYTRYYRGDLGMTWGTRPIHRERWNTPSEIGATRLFTGAGVNVRGGGSVLASDTVQFDSKVNCIRPGASKTVAGKSTVCGSAVLRSVSSTPRGSPGVSAILPYHAHSWDDTRMNVFDHLAGGIVIPIQAALGQVWGTARNEVRNTGYRDINARPLAECYRVKHADRGEITPVEAVFRLPAIKRSNCLCLNGFRSTATTSGSFSECSVFDDQVQPLLNTRKSADGDFRSLQLRMEQIYMGIDKQAKCDNGGQATIDTVTEEVICTCPPGFHYEKGTSFTCVPNTKTDPECSGHGTLATMGGYYANGVRTSIRSMCVCKLGYSGNACQTEVKCPGHGDGKTCSNHGVCNLLVSDQRLTLEMDGPAPIVTHSSMQTRLNVKITVEPFLPVGWVEPIAPS